MKSLAARIEISKGGFLPSPESSAGQEADGEVKCHGQTVEHHKQQDVVSAEEQQNSYKFASLEEMFSFFYYCMLPLGHDLFCFYTD